MRALLDTLVQVTVSDGRVIMGTLKVGKADDPLCPRKPPLPSSRPPLAQCVDGLGNIVLGQAELARSPDGALSRCSPSARVTPTPRLPPPSPTAIAAESPQQRRQQWMGSVMVPGANVEKVQVPATA